LATTVHVLHIGIGNIGSVLKALEEVGARPVLTNDAKEVARAERLVFPGQGAFAILGQLKSRGLDDAMHTFFASGRPYLGICLGLQVLFADSEESPGTPGLGILEGSVARLQPVRGEKVPHIGWNDVEVAKPDPILEGLASGTDFYFAHSFVAQPTASEVVALRCHHARDFVAAVRHGNVFACQFHPEKSQHAGLRLLKNFVKAS
jgi:glutamine amidotransferase